MTDLDNQVDYWNRVAGEKQFTLPVNLPLLRAHLPLKSHILDYGCGYGRVCRALADEGYTAVTGMDSSAAMIRRGQEQYPDLALEVLPESGLDCAEGFYDAVLLIAVLTCIPTDDGQTRLMRALARALRPGGLICITDYLLQEDERNRQRYETNMSEFGIFGVFRLPEGTVVRHHSEDWIRTLTNGFEPLDWATPQVVTMNGHAAHAFQFLGRKPFAGWKGH